MSFGHRNQIPNWQAAKHMGIKKFGYRMYLGLTIYIIGQSHKHPMGLNLGSAIIID